MIDWEVFVKSHCDEALGMVIHTPLYNWIAENYPITFMNKLITITDYVDDFKILFAASVMIKDVAENRHFLQQLNSGIPIETMEVLKLSAIHLMINSGGITEMEESGKALAAKLLYHVLESGGEWDEFIHQTQRVFYYSGSMLLYMILDVLCTLPTELVARFVEILEPYIIETYAIFPDRMLQLLETGNDHRPYFVLANVCGLFTEPQWSMMMEAAIMSTFFLTVLSSSRRVSVASSLRICFDHEAYFYVTINMIAKMRAIIYCLHKSGEPSEQHAAMELYEAFARRVLKFPIPRN